MHHKCMLDYKYITNAATFCAFSTKILDAKHQEFFLCLLKQKIFCVKAKKFFVSKPQKSTCMTTSFLTFYVKNFSLCEKARCHPLEKFLTQSVKNGS